MFDVVKEIVPVFGMGYAAFIIYLAFKAQQLKNKEKIALIEKGLDPSILDTHPKNQLNSLKIGLLLIGAALGIVFGYLLNLTLGIPNFVAYSTMILVICGIVLVYFHKSKTQ